MFRALALLVVAACGSSSGGGGGDIDGGAVAPDAFVAEVCVDPASVTMMPNLGFAGDVACLDTGVRGGGACPGVLHAGLCPPNVSIKEVAIFVRDEATAEAYVVMRETVTAFSHGVIGDDGESVRMIPDGVDVSVESTRDDGVRARAVFRIDGSMVSVSELHHDAPL